MTWEPAASSPGSRDSVWESHQRSVANRRGSANQTRTAAPSSPATGPTSLACPTCGSWTTEPHGLTSCTADTPASHSQTQGSDEERTTLGICGLSSHAAFAFYDPASLSLRTSQGTFDLDSTPSSPILPAWGCMCGGALYELPTSARLTEGLDCSWLLPTHRVAATRSSRKSMVENQQWSAPSLAQALEIASGMLPREFETWEEVPGRSGMLPTPRATRGGSQTETVELLQTPSAADALGGHLSRGGDRSHELLLKGQVKALLPTPTAHDDGKSPEAHMAMKQRLPGGPRQSITSLAVLARADFEQPLMPTPTAGDSKQARNSTANRKSIPPTGIHAGDTLTDAVTLLPTPSANDSTGAESATRQARQETGETGGPSLRDLTHLLPGDSTSPPSDGGNPSTAPHPGQLTIGDG